MDFFPTTPHLPLRHWCSNSLHTDSDSWARMIVQPVAFQDTAHPPPPRGTVNAEFAAGSKPDLCNPDTKSWSLFSAMFLRTEKGFWGNVKPSQRVEGNGAGRERGMGHTHCLTGIKFQFSEHSGSSRDAGQHTVYETGKSKLDSIINLFFFKFCVSPAHSGSLCTFCKRMLFLA